MKKIYKSDWINSKIIFYNERLCCVSENINDVIDFSNLKFHKEGLINYLNFGYSVFEQTPIQDVKFLRHSSELTEENDILSINYLKDDCLDLLNIETKEDEVWDMLSELIGEWEKQVNGDIVIPTSGGFDSRILNFFIKDKNRIRSFTYGISDDQSKSFEVLYAKDLARILGTKWQQIILEDFNEYIENWYDIYGISTHAHGMYHMEFYDKISRMFNNLPLLSGVIGDAWAGSVNFGEIINTNNVIDLGYSHGMNADINQCLFSSEDDLICDYLDKHKTLLRDPKYRVLESMRFKMTLLNYLIKIPSVYGFKPWSPFLNVKIAMSMLNLPEDRRKNRVWQRDFFKKNKLNLEDITPQVNKMNTLNLQVIKQHDFKPLNVDLLRELFKKNYIEWINKRLKNSRKTLMSKQMYHNAFSNFYFIPKMDTLFYKIGLDRYSVNNEESRAYYAYLVIKPIEMILEQRNKV